MARQHVFTKLRNVHRCAIRAAQVCADKGSYSACLLDTKGPEIRTAMLRGGKDIELVAGQKVTRSSSPAQLLCM